MANPKNVEKSVESDDELLEIARKRFRMAEDAESEVRLRAIEDVRFSIGEQWPEEIKRNRETDHRPCLTINRIPQFIHQITNDQRQNRPSIKVNPVDNQADIKTAKILQGIIRHIEYNSNADVAYDTAFDGAVRMGFGYIRVTTDYCDPTSFDQEIYIKRVRNHFSVFLDPLAQEPDGSDANFAFVFDDVPKDEYKALYPNSEVASRSDMDSLGLAEEGWITANTVRIAEYFTKEFEEVEIALIADAQGNQAVVHATELDKMPEGFQLINKRTTRIPRIRWYKINGCEILERTDWPGSYIPIVPVIGDEIDVEGKRILEGVIRHAKDPQRMYNYWASAETETIALAPRAPFIGYAGQFEGFESQWSQANSRNFAYLEVNSKDSFGNPMPLPQRNVYEPPVQAITQARMQSSEDLKATTGIYDASLGNRSNENSGIAIQRRSAQAQTSNFHFVDNLSRAIRHVGCILVDLIPKVYDTPRAIRIIGEDGEVDTALVNQMFEEAGESKGYYLGKGKYDVTVSTGPSYATKRQEAAASMLDLTKIYPPLMQAAGDLLVRSLDWPGSDDVAERLKKTMPPELVGDDKAKQQPIPPQVQAQIQQMNQMIDQLTKAYHAAQDQVDTRKMELESKERIAAMQTQAEIEIALAKIGSADSQVLLKHEIEGIKHRLELLHFNSAIDAEGVGSEGSEPLAPEQQPPTGGLSPGQPME